MTNSPAKKLLAPTALEKWEAFVADISARLNVRGKAAGAITDFERSVCVQDVQAFLAHIREQERIKDVKDALLRQIVESSTDEGARRLAALALAVPT